MADYQGTRLTEGIDTGDISVPSLAERGGDFSQVPLTGSVNGNAGRRNCLRRLGADSHGRRALCAGLSHRADSAIHLVGARQNICWPRFPQPNAGAAVFETATAAETLGDNKGGLRADWSRGKGTLTGYYFLDQYSLDNPYPTGTGGANVPGFDATSNGRAQLASLATHHDLWRVACSTKRT